MNLPKSNFKIKVGPFIYQVKYSVDVANEGSIFGSCHNNEQIIFLDPNKPKQKIEQTFIHELLHACMFVNGLCYRFDKDESSSKPNEEDIARDMSMTLYQVFIDNPTVFK